MKIKMKNKPITSTSLVSMTDVVFLLLIFLLISSSFVTYNGIKVNIPSSTTIQKEVSKNVYLTLTIDDQIYINNNLSEWNSVVDDLKTIYEQTPESVILIQADQEIPLKKVIALIDVTKKAGCKKFFIATKMIQPGDNTNVGQ